MPFPGALQALLGPGDGSSGPLCRAQTNTAPPTPASHYLRHSGSRLGGWWGGGGALEVGRGSGRAAVDGL